MGTDDQLYKGADGRVVVTITTEEPWLEFGCRIDCSTPIDAAVVEAVEAACAAWVSAARGQSVDEGDGRG